MSRRFSRASIALLLVLAASLATPGCLFKKKKLPAAPQLPLAPVRVVLLPANVPPDNHELRWLSIGVTVLMAKQTEDAQDLEVVPLWESLPIALETLGATRTVGGETPEVVASRLNAKWAPQIELSPGKKGISLRIDFMPTKASMFAYRYETETSVESIHTALREAVEQFLRYLQVRPLVKGGKGSKSVDPKELRALAEAIDQEYGWFSPADPGKAEKTFASLARSDTRLARLLIKPAASSESGARPAAQLPGLTNAPSAAPTPSGEVSPAPPASSPQPQVSLTPPSKPSETPPQVPASEIIKSTRGGDAGKPSGKSPRPGEKKATAAPSASSSKAPPEIKPVDPPKGNESQNTRSSSELAPPMMYWIEVNATLSKAEADAHAERYAKAGFHAEVVQVELKDKGPGYRVRLKGFDSRKAAEEAALKLVTDGVITEYWIVP